MPRLHSSATRLVLVESWMREVSGGLEVDVWVVPGSSRDAVVGPYGDALKVRVSAPADGGRANDAVAALLSEHFGAAAMLLRGHTSRSKTYRLIR